MKAGQERRRKEEIKYAHEVMTEQNTPIPHRISVARALSCKITLAVWMGLVNRFQLSSPEAATARYLIPAQSNFVDRLDVSDAKSPLSISATLISPPFPLVAASSAAPAPVAPPPIISTSNGLDGSDDLSLRTCSWREGIPAGPFTSRPLVGLRGNGPEGPGDDAASHRAGEQSPIDRAVSPTAEARIAAARAATKAESEAESEAETEAESDEDGEARRSRRYLPVEERADRDPPPVRERLAREEIMGWCHYRYRNTPVYYHDGSPHRIRRSKLQIIILSAPISLTFATLSRECTGVSLLVISRPG